LINPNKKRGFELKVKAGYTELKMPAPKQADQPRFSSQDEKRIQDVQLKY
jgi:hypothetical protein